MSSVSNPNPNPSFAQPQAPVPEIAVSLAEMDRVEEVELPPSRLAPDATIPDGTTGTVPAASVGTTTNSDVNANSAMSPVPVIDNSSNNIDNTNNNGSSHRTTATATAATTTTTAPVTVLCGPLLNYKRISDQHTGKPIWHGSVLLVLGPNENAPDLLVRLNRADVENPNDAPGARSSVPSNTPNIDVPDVGPTFLYADARKSFYRYSVSVPMLPTESEWCYTFRNVDYQSRHRPDQEFPFVVPASSQSMRMMFHSCNGFSVGTDMKVWSGPNGKMWKEALRFHREQPFHLMIGGGDQIYNDGIRVDGPLQAWTAIKNPFKRQHHPFPDQLRAECDDYYFTNYARWFGSEDFCVANATIPQLNIWDDHDIIDGFGSYSDHFMRCAVFRGIGGVAHKYYLLFQHHLAPPVRTFITDDLMDPSIPQAGTRPADQAVYEADRQDPMYVFGHRPGPFLQEHSRNVVTQLGARIAFVGVDARTERTHRQINYDETYNLIFTRIREHLTALPDTKHLIVLLGVPIAYPRLQWLENLLRSKFIAPLSWLHRKFGFINGVFNKFDGKADLLDDLNDHYTTHTHKPERRVLIQRLQALGQEFSVRVTILGGDVHLAAVGRFYSHPRHRMPVSQDWRYIPNIISSAITNMPPPSIVADVLARRNKIHHMDADTDETMLELFNRFPYRVEQQKEIAGGHKPSSEPVKKAGLKNHTTMPSRNFAIIEEGPLVEVPETTKKDETTGITTTVLEKALPIVSESQPRTTGGSANNTFNNGADMDAGAAGTRNPRHAIHPGERMAGTKHPAASGFAARAARVAEASRRQGGQTTTGARSIGLNVTIRVEIDSTTGTGDTDGYGLWIPPLEVPTAKTGF